MAPVLVANVLTVAFVYAFAKIAQKERSGRGAASQSWRNEKFQLVMSGLASPIVLH
jgi:hypothetical protein